MGLRRIPRGRRQDPVRQLRNHVGVRIRTSDLLRQRHQSPAWRSGTGNRWSRGASVPRTSDCCLSVGARRSPCRLAAGVLRMAWQAHETAIVDEGARVGDGTRIWHWVHVCARARIGEGCSLGQNVYVGNRVVIGNNVKIQNNVSVYDNVTLEDDVFCGPSMVFTNVYNPRSAVSRKRVYRDTLIKRGATLGANCTIICGVTIGEYAFIGAGAVVNRDVPAYALMAGVPARQIGWMSRYGERLPLPMEGTGEAQCPHTGDRYRLDGRALTRIPE